MLGISHNEVRRHPRWREELKTPLHMATVERAPGTRLLTVVAACIIVTALLVLVLN